MCVLLIVIVDFCRLGDPELDLEARVSMMLSVGEECITEEELRALVQHKIFKGLETVAYDGFEPSGRMHIAQGVMKAINVNKLTRCGCTFKFWVADWFAMLNNKMDGDLKKIRTVGQYMIEVCRRLTIHEFSWWMSSKCGFQLAGERANKRVCILVQKNEVETPLMTWRWLSWLCCRFGQRWGWI